MPRSCCYWDSALNVCSQLDEVLSEAETLADKPRFTRFLRTKQDADAITRMREKISNARQNFQVRAFFTTLAYTLSDVPARSFKVVLLLRS